MLTGQQIFRALKEAAFLLRQDFDMDLVQPATLYASPYGEDEFSEFKRDLIAFGDRLRILMVENELAEKQFLEFLTKTSKPVFAFTSSENKPILLQHRLKELCGTLINEDDSVNVKLDPSNLSLLKNEQGKIVFLSIFNYENPLGETRDSKSISPIRRLARLLQTERKDIFYILVYAVFVGLMSLILPLGIQSTIELVSGGVIFSSVYLMIGVVVVGVIVSGALQIVQFRLVEYLQQRVFTKAAFEFAFRIPRIRMEALAKTYAPELINRFFDIITIQKGLPKLLIDLSSAVIQILFGLLLISLYHPFFVFFSLLLVAILIIIFYFTGAIGLHSSIMESKYKYKVVHWLEELARSMHSFKLAGNTDLPIQKTDYYTIYYLKNRKIHFNALITQYGFIVLFKAAIVGGLLIMGTNLVVDRQITLGQFVASEVIIILVLGAVEKIIMYMEVVYDLLTAVDKVAHVTDLAVERMGGIDLKNTHIEGFSLSIKALKYKYLDQQEYQLKGIDLNISPAERICISGPSGSGKSTLANIISGLYTNYEGLFAINNFSMRDLNLTNVRKFVAKNISSEDLFDGTILENITVGKPSVTAEDVVFALSQVGVLEQVNTLPEGLNTHVLSGGKGFSETFIYKLIVARCLAEKPRLMVLNDFLFLFTESAKIDLLERILKAAKNCTVIFISNDPIIQNACDRVIWLEDGKVKND